MDNKHIFASFCMLVGLVGFALIVATVMSVFHVMNDAMVVILTNVMTGSFALLRPAVSKSLTQGDKGRCGFMINPQEFTNEMRDLLIRLDEKVSAGFTSVNDKLDQMDRRADNHEQRIHSLEKRADKIETTAMVSIKFGSVLWGVGGAGALVLVVFLMKLFFTYPV